MYFLLPLVYLLLSTGTVVYILKEKFGKSLPVSMILTSLFLFISQMLFHTFFTGYILCIIFALLCPLLLLYKKVKKDDISVFKNNYFSYGLFVFILLYIFVYILNIGKEFTFSDEFSFWGYNLKYMLQTDSYIKIASHLPFISTFEMFICNLRGGYSEGAATFAIQLFEFGLLIPCISEFTIKDKKINVSIKTFLLMILSMLLVFTFDFDHTSTSVYTDAFMMLYLAYLIFQTTVYDYNKKSNIAIFAISVYGFVLNKQIVLALLLIPLFNLLVRFILENKKEIFTKKNIFKVLKFIIICLVVPLIFIKIWGLYIAGNERGSSPNFMAHFINVLLGKESTTYEFTAVENFLKAITNRNIFVSNIASLTFISLLCIIYLVMFYIHKKDKKFNKNTLISLSLSFLVGSIGYMFIFLVMYSFGGFNQVEGLRLASYERYFSTFLMGLIATLGMVLIYLNKDKHIISYKTIIIAICIMGVFVPGDRYYCFLPGALRNSSYEKELIVKEKRVAKSINDLIDDEKCNILVLSDDIEGSIYIKYYAEEYNYDFGTYSYSESKSYDEFIDRIKEFDYLVIFDDNEETYSYLEKITNDDIIEESLYKINKDDMMLTKVG